MSFRSFDLLNLVRDFGEDLTLRKVTTSGAYNPATGEIDGSGTTDYTVTGYFYNYETLNVDQIRKGTRKCVISALDGHAPDEDDQLVGNGDTVAITAVTTIFSSGSAVCYICHVEE
jgi:hypothetical protein